ncbi:hypothetical protein HanRHA438_Chr09g0420191 [Helianthus annuus]|nr:hypothetical protein HanRHA438_Chr09g0420191 [Helianthus annuus]
MSRNEDSVALAGSAWNGIGEQMRRNNDDAFLLVIMTTHKCLPRSCGFDSVSR